ncbi:hypothetical protein C8J56DRAFT_1165823 [Mycena floridula]|nr:hypothetical protein C8J56DRAFT_1165823 [Mycena floridula]
MSLAFGFTDPSSSTASPGWTASGFTQPNSSTSSSLTPRASAPRKRLVPKKSKLGLLSRDTYKDEGQGSFGRRSTHQRAIPLQIIHSLALTIQFVGFGDTAWVLESARDASVSVGLDVSPDIGIFESMATYPRSAMPRLVLAPPSNLGPAANLESAQNQGLQNQNLDQDSIASGGDTPPLSASDGSSMSDIDLEVIDMVLANSTHPIANSSTFSIANFTDPIANPAIANRIRLRARGNGHCRRISQAQQSRSSVYETIEEEMPSPGPESVQQSPMSLQASPTPMSSMPSLMSLQQSSN